MSPPIGDHTRGPALGLAVFVLSCGNHPDDGNADEHVELNTPDNTVAGTASAPLPQAIPTAAQVPDATLPDDPLIVGDPLLQEQPANEILDICDRDDASVAARFQPYGVHHESPVRRTLYSWTRAAQIEELRQDPTLLTRTVNAQGERGRAGELLLAHAATDPIAQVLSEERFAKTRHAWANSWATLQGWTGEDYGNRLLAITLKPEAWVAEMRNGPRGLAWRFFDMAGQIVSEAAFLAASERLGAIYFVDDANPGDCSGEFGSAGSILREYVLPNEAMIERYEAFTAALRAKVKGELEALQAMAQVFGSGCDSGSFARRCWHYAVAQRWGAEPELTRNKLLGQYEASLAFPNDLYLPLAGNLERLVSRLEAVPFDEPPLEYVYPTL